MKTSTSSVRRAHAARISVVALAAACALSTQALHAQPIQLAQALQAPAPEAQMPPAVLAQALRLATDAAQVLAPHGAHVSAEAGRLDARLTLAPCARVETYLPAGVPAWGRVRVGLRCTDGVARWNVYLPVDVHVMAPALVAAAPLAAGTRLDETQLRLIEVDWSVSSAALFDSGDSLRGRVLSRALQPGQAVQAAHLQARQWFAAGDTVRIVAAGPGFSIVSEGQALTPGQEGKPARVQTENGRVLSARPVSDRCVEISL